MYLVYYHILYHIIIYYIMLYHILYHILHIIYIYIYIYAGANLVGHSHSANHGKRTCFAYFMDLSEKMTKTRNTAKHINFALREPLEPLTFSPLHRWCFFLCLLPPVLCDASTTQRLFVECCLHIYIYIYYKYYI